jgi:DNA-binding MarR family transcriptional regulator
MEKLVVLYFIDLTFGSVGQGKVSRNDLARWFMTSKPTVARFMDAMVKEGLVNQHEIGSNKTSGFIVKYSMTKEGKEYLDNHFDAAYDLYRIQVAKVLAAIEAKKPAPEYRELSAKEKRQIAAGQKELL